MKNFKEILRQFWFVVYLEELEKHNTLYSRKFYQYLCRKLPEMYECKFNEIYREIGI